MSRKKNKKETIKIMSGIEVSLANRERFNPYQTGYGVHKSVKYPNRTARKAEARKQIHNYI